MKRSEMIDLLHDYTSTFDKNYTDQTRDEAIIDFLEKHGMAPPEVGEPVETQVVNQLGQVLTVEKSTLFVRRWEDETE